jgi:hypothetical protein
LAENGFPVQDVASYLWKKEEKFLNQQMAHELLMDGCK